MVAIGTSAAYTHLTLLLILLLPACQHAQQTDQVICPRIGTTFEGPNRLDTVDPVKRIAELSGQALSPTQVAPSGKPVLFGFGDGGTGERIGVWDSETGDRIMTLQIRSSIIVNQDWESMTIGSCGSTGADQSCLYVVDSGDNTGRASNGRRSGRNSVPYRILKIKEPNIKDFKDNDHIPIGYLSALEYDYRNPTSPTNYADSEVSFVDHTGWGEGGTIGDLYIVTKWGTSRGDFLDSDNLEFTRLFKIPTDAWPDEMCGSYAFYSPEVVGSYEFTSSNGQVTGGQLMGREWRGGEMSYDGTLIALGDKDNASIFLRCPGESVADALAAPNAGTQACVTWGHAVTGQVETLSFLPDGSETLNIPEGNRPRMGFTPLIYDSSSTTETCSTPLSSFPSPPRLKIPRKRNLQDCAPTEPPTDHPSPRPTFQGETYSPTATPRPSRSPTIPTPRPVARTEDPTTSPTMKSSTPPTVSPVDPSPTTKPSVGLTASSLVDDSERSGPSGAPPHKALASAIVSILAVICMT